MADHIDHVRKVAGIDHVGIGSDFDGFDGATDGLEDVSCYPALLAELMRRGYTREDIQKLAGLNLLRVFREAEKVSARLKRETTVAACPRAVMPQSREGERPREPKLLGQLL